MQPTQPLDAYRLVKLDADELRSVFNYMNRLLAHVSPEAATQIVSARAFQVDRDYLTYQTVNLSAGDTDRIRRTVDVERVRRAKRIAGYRIILETLSPEPLEPGKDLYPGRKAAPSRR